MPCVAEPSAPKYGVALNAPEPGFAEVVGMIRQARAAAHQAVNTALIDLYWRVAGYILPADHSEAELHGGLVAFEMKATEFEPGHLGQLEFYLEALDRDVKLSHERPSIGVLLCATRTAEVVEYALAPSASPALVAEYTAHLPSKALLEAKLAEYTAMARGEGHGSGS